MMKIIERKSNKKIIKHTTKLKEFIVNTSEHTKNTTKPAAIAMEIYNFSISIKTQNKKKDI